ncbi:putative F-box protein At3g25750 [Tasmannia lanceolata]|uniref:putative F-box protein At3g25750 n=1 Tax=Tasmannia lanceolata TaxID=3420 RepID=UPI004063A635
MEVVNNRWSQLPKEILGLILKRLSLTDYLRFGGVCVSWRSVMAERCHPLAPQPPWIMLYSHGDSEIQGFFCLTEKRVYKLNLPEVRGRWCCGSSEGWLIMTDLIKGNFLLNPISRARIHLPSQISIPCSGPGYIRKAILSSPPTCNNSIPTDCVVAAILYDNRLGFCRLGEGTWNVFEDRDYDYTDAIFCKGSLYAINTSWELRICRLGPHPKSQKVLPPMNCELNRLVHLVESCGELLMVSRILDFCVASTLKLQVFKLDLSVPHWVEVKNLGDHVLFLGRSCCKSLSTSDFPGFRGNCIYFTDEDITCKSGVELRVFHLEDCSIKPYLLSNYHSFMFSHIWVTPNPW